MTVITAFLLCVIGVKCAAPMAHMARTARTIAATVLTGSAMLSQESACATLAFMAPSRSRCVMLMWMFCVINSTLGCPKTFFLFMFFGPLTVKKTRFYCISSLHLSCNRTCQPGQYGVNCNQTCSCHDKICDPVSGACYLRKKIFIYSPAPTRFVPFSSKQ